MESDMSSGVHVPQYRPATKLEAGFVHATDRDMLVQHAMLPLARSQPAQALAAAQFGIPQEKWESAVSRLQHTLCTEPWQVMDSSAQFHAFLSRCNLADPASTAEHCLELVPMVAAVQPQATKPPAAAAPRQAAGRAAPRSSPSAAYATRSSVAKGDLAQADTEAIVARVRPLYHNTRAMELADAQFSIGPALWVRAVAKLRRVLCSDPKALWFEDGHATAQPAPAAPAAGAPKAVFSAWLNKPAASPAPAPASAPAAPSSPAAPLPLTPGAALPRTMTSVKAAVAALTQQAQDSAAAAAVRDISSTAGLLLTPAPFAAQAAAGSGQAVGTRTSFLPPANAPAQWSSLQAAQDTWQAFLARGAAMAANANNLPTGKSARAREARADAEAAASQACLDMIPLVARTAEVFMPEEVALARKMRSSADLRATHEWYPVARSVKRRVVFHAGPTNSGKTYHALQALKGVQQGVYAGPLRLLALEVYETLNRDGVIANLLTGQERSVMPFATHMACTVEMAPTEELLDCAVLDEVQLLADPQRGWAWTRAYMGLAAKELHVCGEPAALPAVQALADMCGDTVEVAQYSRLTPLRVEERSLEGDLRRIQPGDAVIAFNRRSIYSLREEIEACTPYKCAVVYGSLPPETRSKQAARFNDPDSDAQVLVATDAVGMGMNLNIKRVVFHAMEKFKYHVGGTAPLSPADVKQIAGRAGRARSAFKDGSVTTLHEEDMPFLREAMAAEAPAITHAGQFPGEEQLLAFSALLPPETPLDKLLVAFMDASQVQSDFFFMCRHEEVVETARALHEVPGLTLSERIQLCAAPVKLRQHEPRVAFLEAVRAIAARTAMPMEVQLPLAAVQLLQEAAQGGVRSPRVVQHAQQLDFEVLEGRAAIVDLYIWLAYRFPRAFPDLERATQLRSQVCDAIDVGLAALSTVWARRRQRRSQGASQGRRRAPPSPQRPGGRRQARK